MKSMIYAALISTAAMFLSQDAAAQCLQNGIPCNQTQSATTGTPVPSTGTLAMGTDGTTTYPLLTDGAGRSITSIYSLPSLPTGSNTIGSIGNTAFGISGTLPGFASTPTFNLGTLNGAATSAKQDTLIANLGSPFQAGGTIGNTAFGISGQLPAFAATPTFNLGTAPTLTVNDQASVTSAAPTYSNGTTQPLSLTTAGALRVDGSAATQPVSGTVTANIGTAPVLTTNIQGSVTTSAPTYTNGTSQPLNLTTSGALRVDTGGTTQTVNGTVTANIGTTNGLALDTTVNGLFKAGQSIGNTSFGATQSGTWNVGLSAGTNAIGTVSVTSLPALSAGTNIIGSVAAATFFTETTTALAASGAFTGTSRDSGVAGSPIPYGFFSCFTFANVAGTLTMAGSNNNSTFYTVVSQAISANTPLTTTSRVMFRYMRCSVTNSTTAQTTFVLNSQFGN